MAPFEIGEIKRATYIKHIGKMGFILSSSSIVISASRMLCELNNESYSSNFSKNSQNVRFRTIPIGLYIVKYPPIAHLVGDIESFSVTEKRSITGVGDRGGLSQYCHYIT